MVMNMQTMLSFQKEIFRGIEKPQRTKVYKLLCDRFPLEEIKDNKQHKNALSVVEHLIEYLDAEHAGITSQIKEETETYLATLGILVEQFEMLHFPVTGKVTARSVLRYLMDANGLTQKDLKKEIGTQAHVSMILAGKRDLTVAQIKALAVRFNISPNAFL